MSRTIIKKMLKAKKALNHTIQKILEINQKQKQRLQFNRELQQQQTFNEELRLLNKMAASQARIIRHYETILDRRVGQN
jgi:hypothetical protein